MTAGREWDALIAEKVMGIVLPDHLWLHPLNISPEQAMQIILPPYSISIAAAWEVFCKFTSRYLWYDDATDTWHCHLDATRRVMEDCRHHATSEDETGAEAICLAALKAVGCDVPQETT